MRIKTRDPSPPWADQDDFESSKSILKGRLLCPFYF